MLPGYSSGGKGQAPEYNKEKYKQEVQKMRKQKMIRRMKTRDRGEDVIPTDSDISYTAEEFPEEEPQSNWLNKLLEGSSESVAESKEKSASEKSVAVKNKSMKPTLEPTPEAPAEPTPTPNRVSQRQAPSVSLAPSKQMLVSQSERQVSMSVGTMNSEASKKSQKPKDKRVEPLKPPIMEQHEEQTNWIGFLLRFNEKHPYVLPSLIALVLVLIAFSSGSNKNYPSKKK